MAPAGSASSSQALKRPIGDVSPSAVAAAARRTRAISTIQDSRSGQAAGTPLVGVSNDRNGPFS